MLWNSVVVGSIHNAENPFDRQILIHPSIRAHLDYKSCTFGGTFDWYLFSFVDNKWRVHQRIRLSKFIFFPFHIVL